MISIIIASVNPQLKKQISKNIETTIGCKYELLIKENSISPKGLCRVYNKCSQKAKHPYIVFVHEDVIFHTQNWGKIIIKHLKNEKTGLIGIAGSKYKSKLPGPWWGVPDKLKKIHIIQGPSVKKTNRIEKVNNEEKVAVIDGVFMACRKQVWELHKFDERTFTGFHNYDIDFSIAVNQTHNIICINDILIEHFSAGSYNQGWLMSSIKVSKKWNKLLPIFTEAHNRKEIKNLELKSYEKFIELLTGRTKNPLLLINHLIFYLLKRGRFKFAFIQLYAWTKKQKYQS